MEITKTLYVKERNEWRQWLEKNFDTQKEIWLIFPNKNSNKTRIKYNDAVEEALCYGWIDSTIKSMDDDHACQRFTPRNRRSSYSQPNKERLKWLSEQNMIHPSVEKLVRDIIREEFVFPADIISSIKKDKAVWNNYLKFTDPYKRIRIAYIDAARTRPEEFKRRLKHFMDKTRDNKLIGGFGGIEKYY